MIIGKRATRCERYNCTKFVYRKLDTFVSICYYDNNNQVKLSAMLRLKERWTTCVASTNKQRSSKERQMIFKH